MSITFGTAKTNKSKPIPDLDLKDVDSYSTRFSMGTERFKVFNNV